MCGISGCLTTQSESVPRSVVDALTKLQNRGYDSAGFCLVVDGAIEFEKSVSAPGENAMKVLQESSLLTKTSTVAIGHTRWATHGGKTIPNTHPHHDANRTLALVHNGIIENYRELQEELEEFGYTFYGQTDTEVATKYYHHLMSQGRGIGELTSSLRGSWAMLALEASRPDRISYTKSGSPLILGFNTDRSKAMFVSELSGFDPDIDQYVIIRDGDFGYVELLDSRIVHQTDLTYDPQPMTAELVETSPAPYPHWTLKEIHDQAITVQRFLKENTDEATGQPRIAGLQPGFLDKIRVAEHLIFLGCGTSYNAAQVGVHYMKALEVDKTFSVIDGADFEVTDLPSRPTILILLSQSGETKDLHRALQIRHPSIIGTLGIVNVENSLIARETDCCLYLRAGREQAVASTKSFTNQVVALVLLFLTLSPLPDLSDYYRGILQLATDIRKAILTGLDKVQDILPFFEGQTSCFVLGKQASEWIGREGALKIKEISYIHAEGFSAAALKHGPFALLSQGVPVILLGNNDTSRSKIENVSAEVKSRDACVIQISNHPAKGVDYHLSVDTSPVFFPLVSVISLQILSYRLALARGNNPDYPRNLAKVVTVE